MSSTLTPKEERITALVVQGMKNHEISKIIGTTENVIENYLRIIFDKTGTWTRLELALWYLENKRIQDCQYGCGDLPLGCGPPRYHALGQFVETRQSDSERDQHS